MTRRGSGSPAFRSSWEQVTEGKDLPRCSAYLCPAGLLRRPDLQWFSATLAVLSLAQPAGEREAGAVEAAKGSWPRKSHRVLGSGGLEGLETPFCRVIPPCL
jgi:hypothetical protein